jgi:hypothetical protein
MALSSASGDLECSKVTKPSWFLTILRSSVIVTLHHSFPRLGDNYSPLKSKTCKMYGTPISLVTSLINLF